MLQACLNGGRTADEAPAAPITPGSLAADAIAARAAGADEAHIHPRDASGAETLEPGAVAACLRAVRAASPGMPVGIGTGDWIAPGGPARHAHMRSWTEKPDYVSINLNEPDAPDVAALMSDIGVGVEAGVWTLADADRLIDEFSPEACLRVLVEMTSEDPRTAVDEADAVLARLQEGGFGAVPKLLHGLDGSAWACVQAAAERGLQTRIGFEDVLTMPDGAPAESNAALVAAAREMLEEARRR